MNKKIARLYFFMAFLLLAFSPAFSEPFIPMREKTPPVKAGMNERETQSRRDFIPTKDIRPGMVGYGKTVFQGTKISTFRVVVLGILRKAVADTDLILVKIESPYLKKRGIGLVSGMSGSPVYIDGKLAGAIAYGWPFTSEAVAGVTPIEAMMNSSTDEKEPSVTLGSPKIVHLLEPLKIENESIDTVSTLLPGQKAEQFPHSLVLEPLGLTLAASGLDAEGLGQLGAMFPMLNVVPGGSKMSLKDPVPLEPGQSVGAALIQGDMNVVATGTLTYRSGTKVLAFGHPFLFLGNVDFPMVETYVHYILPSMQLPFKFASAMRDVGHVAQDRLFGIGGVIGKPSHLVPLDITVKDEERGSQRHFHVEIIRNEELTPKLASLAIGQAIPAAAKLLGGATASLDYTVQFEGYPSIHVKNLIFSESSIAAVAAGEILKPVLEVLGNDFQKVNLARVTVSVKVEPRILAASLQRIELSKHSLKPGEPLTVTVWLKPYNEKIVKKSFRVEIPSDVQGNVLVGVCGGPNDDQLRKTLMQTPPEPLNVNQIIGQIQDAAPYNSLVIRLAFPRSSMNWGGENFDNFPQAYIDLLKAAGSSPLALHSDGAAHSYSMPWVIVGSQTEQITVEGKENPAPPQAKPEQPPSQPSPNPPQMPPSVDETSWSNVDSADVAQPKENGQPSPPAPPARPTPPAEPAPLPTASTPPAEETSTTLETIESLKDWQEGTLNNLAISSEGNLALAPLAKTLAHFDENVLLAETRFEENVYVGTGNPGKIYQIGQTGGKKLFFDPKTEAVLSMASLPNGDLLAGTIDGNLWWLDPSGKMKFHFKLPEHYVWQILPWHDTIYVATGSPSGKIYKLDENNPQAKGPVVFASSMQSHITTLYAFQDGRIFAGTASNGLLLQAMPDGTLKTADDLNEQAVLSLTGDSNGNLFIGTSGKGAVYVLEPAGRRRLLAELPDQNVTWLGVSGDKILAATGIPSRLYAVDYSGNISLLWDGKSREMVGLKGDPSGKSFFVSGSHAGVFEISQSFFRRGELNSKVMDAGTQATWGRLTWRGQTPQGTKISILTRTGNSPVPDSTWSKWSSPYPSQGETFQSPPSRYMQFQVRLSQDSPGGKPELEAISFFWRPSNRPPSVTILSPQPGEVIGPKTTLRGKLSDPDGDTLKLELWAKRGKDLQRIYSSLYPTKTKGTEDFSIPLNLLHEEGQLDLKIAVSDGPSNAPDAALTTSTLVKDLTFASTAPTVAVTGVHSLENKAIRVEGTATDHSSYVKEVKFRIDAGPWLDTIPQNGLFDSEKETFYFQLEDLSKIKEIEIRAEDGAGNETILKQDVKSLVAKITPSFALPQLKKNNEGG